MNGAFRIEEIGKSKVTSHLTHCAGCSQLRLLTSYITTRVAMFFFIPVLPLGRQKILDECPTCGHRGLVKARRFNKERKKNLNLMMEGFTHSADDPENCCFALHTLMIYDEAAWFQDIQKSYGIRFDSNLEIQLLIARGLCRFGDYDQAIEHCRKAIALGGGKSAQDLLEFCLAALVATKHSLALEDWVVKEESSRTAYIPIISFATAMMILFVIQGVSAFRSYQAWMLNGSLREYSFILDGEQHTLLPGHYQQIKLRLGDHVLEFDAKPVNRFTYSMPLIKQLLNKQMLVINPDAMALLAMTDTQEEAEPQTTFSFGEQIRILDGARQPQLGTRKPDADAKSPDTFRLYRPETHVAMVELMRSFGLNRESNDYARRALNGNPSTDESAELLGIALDRSDVADARAFLQKGLDTTPILLPWHLYYQNFMKIHQPDYNLEHEYTLRCKNHPDEPLSYYLLARVVNDRPSAYKFYEYSERQPGMKGEGFYAIARDLFIQGQFKEALPYAEKARSSDETNFTFIDLNEQIHLALRDYDALVEHTKSSKLDIMSMKQAKDIVLYLTCAGYHQEAIAETVRLSQQHEERLPSLNAVRYYAVGNIDDYLACLAEAGDPHAELERFLRSNRFEEADQFISQNETYPYWEHLVLYCAAMNQGRLDMAETNLQKAADKAGHKTLARHTITQLLSKDSEPATDAIRDLDIDAQEKAVLCVALGYRFPEQQKSFNALASEYNFNRSYPQLLLKRWIRAPSPRSGDVQ